jgi:hypothetical protein
LCLNKIQSRVQKVIMLKKKRSDFHYVFKLLCNIIYISLCWLCCYHRLLFIYLSIIIAINH